jgi:2-polyprenyl-6-methoxyphenol hydroxylase-like FAD-dependent oxidoreductase
LRANFVVGCDGGASGVRDFIGTSLLGSTYTERWLVIDAIVKNHDIKQITFGCDPRRPRVELPAVGERVRWEFMQLPGETEEVLKSDDRICSLVTETSKYRRFDIERKAVYTFHVTERAPVVRRMVEVSRRLGSIIMPTGRIAAVARDTVFAFLNLFGGFRSFIGRCGVVRP